MYIIPDIFSHWDFCFLIIVDGENLHPVLEDDRPGFEKLQSSPDGNHTAMKWHLLKLKKGLKCNHKSLLTATPNEVKYTNLL